MRRLLNNVFIPFKLIYINTNTKSYPSSKLPYSAAIQTSHQIETHEDGKSREKIRGKHWKNQ